MPNPTTLAESDQLGPGTFSELAAQVLQGPILPPPKADPALTSAQALIAERCDQLKALLLEKNRKYGNSALEPANILARASAVDQILVRIDDKLKRFANQAPGEDEDLPKDLAGYFILLGIALDQEKA